jgi:hypothetical protein
MHAQGNALNHTHRQLFLPGSSPGLYRGGRRHKRTGPHDPGSVRNDQSEVSLGRLRPVQSHR